MMEEMKPIFRRNGKPDGLPCPDKVPVPDLPDSIKPKVSMPKRTGIVWDAVRHFLFGVLEGGGGALTALAAAGVMANPAAWPIIGACAAAFGAVEMLRKVQKEKSGGKDWTDYLYILLETIVKLIQSKGVKK